MYRYGNHLLFGKPATALFAVVISMCQVRAEDADVLAVRLPAQAQRTLDEYLRCVKNKDRAALKDLLYFVDEEDKRLFFAFSPKDLGLLGGAPIEVKKASDTCWLVVLDAGRLLELREVGTKWLVLCPIPGRLRFGLGKLSRAETARLLDQADMEHVQKETDTELEQRRARYLAVLDLKQRHRLNDFYSSAIPTENPAVLAGMSLADLRKAVILKLDAPNGLRFRIRPQSKVFLEGQPILAEFCLENVTDKPIRVRYKPAVEVINYSKAITARGSLVLPKGTTAVKPEDLSPYRGATFYPLAETELKISPKQTARITVDLRKYYDLPPARYSISGFLIPSQNEAARSDTESFEVKTATTSGGPKQE